MNHKKQGNLAGPSWKKAKRCSPCPNAIVPVLHPFAMLFRSPTWRKAQILLIGAILAPGQRTVASALRVMGLSDDRNYARYHQVLNRAVCRPARRHASCWDC